jgi:ABC-2 type transport system ATP-binding protein
MDKDVMIKVEHVSKTFKLPHEKQTSLKGMLIHKFKGGERTYERQNVLQDVSFEVKRGEFFGIVGRNGSGKSTLLKMLAGIYTPTSGSIQINGKLTPFIELGVGFNPELTGRENVFLNGALLGFSRKEMEAMYHEIVSFAELEKFMDQKLKNYSSGMQVRLAFSIAIQVNTDLLVLDEVLAVGDERFQSKCINVFESLKKAGKTIVLVTHDMNSVKRFCTKAIVIHDSKLVYEGDARDAAFEYVKLNFPEMQQEAPEHSGEEHIQVILRSVNGQKPKNNIVRSGDKACFHVTWTKHADAKNVGLAIYSENGQYMYGTNTIIDSVKVKGSSIDYEVTLPLGNGGYYAQVGIFGETDSHKVYFVEKALDFRVLNDELWQGAVKLNHKWVTA